MTQIEKYCEIYHWVAKQYSKDTIERLSSYSVQQREL